MQMPPVPGRVTKNKIFGVHPMLDESKCQLSLVKEENSEATLQEKATGKELCNTD